MMRTDRRIVELVARVLSGDAEDAEVRWVERWVHESPEHERAYRELTAAWELATRAPAAAPSRARPSVETVIAEAERRRGRMPVAAGRAARGWRRAGIAAAAALLLALGARAVLDAGAQTVVADGGVPLTVPLDDGSVIRLAPGARLTVPRRARRTVELDGRAFFAVAPHASVPFVVRAGGARAEVLGTRFELARRGDSLRLVVVEGRVALTARGARVEVPEGHVTWVVQGTPAAPRPDDVWARLEWPGGLLLFQDTPLADALHEIGAQFGVPVTIRDAALARRTVTAWFDGESLEEVVSTVCLAVGARCVAGEGIDVR